MINKTEIFVKIKGIGFTFLLDKKVKFNLISPAFMSFFNIGKREMYSFSDNNVEEVNTNSVYNERNFFSALYNDALPFLPDYVNTINFNSIFNYVGKKVTKCSDNKFRKCKVFMVELELEECKFSFSFLLDKSLNELAVLGKESQEQIKYIADVKTY